MGREVKRVPLDFDWPRNKVWKGYLLPEELHGTRCPDCEQGMTHFGHWLTNYAHVLAMLAEDVHEQARGREMHPWLGGGGRAHGHYEIRRGTPPPRSEWVHADDRTEDERKQGFRQENRFVLDRPGPDALAFFHGLLAKSYEIKRRNGDPDGEYDYEKLYAADTVPPVDQIGTSIGYSSNGDGVGNIQHALIDVLRDAAGVDLACLTCKGQGALEKFEGQFAQRDAWYDSPNEEPPTGDGWQLWETVSEGSPISPVFDAPEALATWMTGPGYAKWRYDELTYEVALKFIKAGWAPSGVVTPGRGFEDGVSFAGREKD